MSEKTETMVKNELVSASEMEILNLDDLDIEALEHRIELASIIPINPLDTDSAVNCGTFACGTFTGRAE